MLERREIYKKHLHVKQEKAYTKKRRYMKN